jgi:Mg-chelatase subunit ChlD
MTEQPGRRIRLPGNEYSEVVCIIDRSGSMISIRQDAIGGFNTFLDEQRKGEGRTALTLVQFDNKYEVMYESTPIDEVEDLTDKTFKPRGTTALLDAIGRTIKDTIARLGGSHDRPRSVVFAIVTDGQENSSVEYNRDQIKELIQGQEAAGWHFFFLAANQDAFAEATAMGIPRMNTTNWDTRHVHCAYRSMGVAARSVGAGLPDPNFSLTNAYDDLVNANGQSSSSETTDRS